MQRIEQVGRHRDLRALRFGQLRPQSFFFFFFNDTATTEIYTLSLHDALPITEPRPSGEHATPTHVQTFGSDRLRVLVVDDEASVRVSLQRYLAGKGHDVETTASGEDALVRLKASKYDAVIVDMRMPDLSGEQ